MAVHFCLNPKQSEAWKQLALRDFVEQAGQSGFEDVGCVVADQCAFGLRHWKSKLLLKKPTLFVSNSPEILNALDRQCNQRHEHGEIVGKGHSELSGRWPKTCALPFSPAFVREGKMLTSGNQFPGPKCCFGPRLKLCGKAICFQLV